MRVGPTSEGGRGRSQIDNKGGNGNKKFSVTWGRTEDGHDKHSGHEGY